MPQVIRELFQSHLQTETWSQICSYKFTLGTTWRLRDVVVTLSSAGWNSSLKHNSQGVEERASLNCYHHFHGRSGMCANHSFYTCMSCALFLI